MKIPYFCSSDRMKSTLASVSYRAGTGFESASALCCVLQLGSQKKKKETEEEGEKEKTKKQKKKQTNKQRQKERKKERKNGLNIYFLDGKKSTLHRPASCVREAASKIPLLSVGGSFLFWFSPPPPPHARIMGGGSSLYSHVVVVVK